MNGGRTTLRTGTSAGVRRATLLALLVAAATTGAAAGVRHAHAEEKAEAGRNFAGSIQLDYLAVPTEKIARPLARDGATVEVSLKLAVDFAGASQILAGSDYPHQIGSIPKMKESLSLLDVNDDERQMILGGNAAQLYGIS